MIRFSFLNVISSLVQKVFQVSEPYSVRATMVMNFMAQNILGSHILIKVSYKDFIFNALVYDKHYKLIF